MRQVFLLSVLVLVGVSVCVAQVMANGGHGQQANPPVNASDVVSYPASQYPVTVSTPSMGMPAVTSSPMGASNSTGNLQAGASAATLNPAAPGSEAVAGAAQSAGNTATNAGFDPGAASSDSAWYTGQSDVSLAQASFNARTMMAHSHPRVYTNDDIARLNQQQGAAPNQASPSTMPGSDVLNNSTNQSQQPNQQTPVQQPNQKPNPFQPH